MTASHPAKFSKSILEWLDANIPTDAKILDPFAGVGGIFSLDTGNREVWGLEIEEEWVGNHPRHLWGDATKLYDWFDKEEFDVICTSPAYGNRMSDSHEAKDTSKRHTYTHYLGHKLHKNNTGQMYAWQPKYKALHAQVWSLCWEVLKPGGLFFLNTKNFIRNGVEFQVHRLHRNLLEEIGFVLESAEMIETPGQRHGANGNLRIDHELIQVFRKV